MKKLVAAIWCCAMLFGLVSCAVPRDPEVKPVNSQGTANELATENTLADAAAFLDENYLMKDGFTTHVPLVVVRENNAIDFYVDRYRYRVDDLEKASPLRATGTELDSAEPADREKKDYRLAIPASLLSTMADRLWGDQVYGEWYLLGNMYDKSLMRTYLAITLAQRLDATSYVIQYCEVFQESEDGMEYRGVYLLVALRETNDYHVLRSETGDNDSGAADSDGGNGDGGTDGEAGSDGGIGDGAIPLNTYAVEQGFLKAPLTLPSWLDLSEAQIERSVSVIDTAEQTVFSSDYNTFSKHDTYFNSRSMYDCFILYEVFGNYSGAQTMHYTLDPSKGTLSPIVSPSFEFSVDNIQDDPFDLYDVRMMEAPYYAELTKDINFVRGLLERYRYLYQTELNNTAISLLVDETSAFLGNARVRDWSRWNHVYVGDDQYILASDTQINADDMIDAPDRNAYSYEQETNKLKYSLSEHTVYMFGGISALYDQDDMVGDDAPYIRNTWMLVVAIVIVVVSVRIVGRRIR